MISHVWTFCGRKFMENSPFINVIPYCPLIHPHYIKIHFRIEVCDEGQHDAGSNLGYKYRIYLSPGKRNLIGPTTVYHILSLSANQWSYLFQWVPFIDIFQLEIETLRSDLCSNYYVLMKYPMLAISVAKTPFKSGGAESDLPHPPITSLTEDVLWKSHDYPFPLIGGKVSFLVARLKSSMYLPLRSGLVWVWCLSPCLF